jgi:hypothetical protein
MAERMRAASSTVGARGPTQSRDDPYAMSPYLETRPYVGLSPTTPQKCAGCRILPPAPSHSHPLTAFCLGDASQCILDTASVAVWLDGVDHVSAWCYRPVSLPSAAAHCPAATAAAEPPEEPPGTLCKSQGFLVTCGSGSEAHFPVSCICNKACTLMHSNPHPCHARLGW